MIEMENFKIKKKDKFIPILFFLNKQREVELEGNKEKKNNLISKEDLQKIFNFEENLKEDKKWNIFESSFKNEINVKEGIKWMHDILYPPLPWWLEKFAFIELESGLEDESSTKKDSDSNSDSDDNDQKQNIDKSSNIQIKIEKELNN